jgi:hypothetical protein
MTHPRTDVYWFWGIPVSVIDLKVCLIYVCMKVEYKILMLEQRIVQAMESVDVVT